VLSVRGICDGLIARPEESYRLARRVCDLENLVNEEAVALVGLQRHTKRNRRNRRRESGRRK
jgi:hypothetical protein